AIDVTIDYLYLPAPSGARHRTVQVETRDEALASEPPDAGGAAPDPPAAATAAAHDLALPATLRLSGSKTIGVSFGRNRDASIDQTLPVEAAGELRERLHGTADT